MYLVYVFCVVTSYIFILYINCVDFTFSFYFLWTMRFIVMLEVGNWEFFQIDLMEIPCDILLNLHKHLL